MIHADTTSNRYHPLQRFVPFDRISIETATLRVSVHSTNMMQPMDNNQPQSPIGRTIPSSDTNPPTKITKLKRGPRGGVYDPFPLKLHRMLDQTLADGLDSVVSWLSHGRAFKIHEPKVFADIIMPKFFNQSKFTSFQRQLNLYGEFIDVTCRSVCSSLSICDYEIPII